MPNTKTNVAKRAVLIGVEDLVFVKLITDDSTGATYDTEYKHVPGLIEVAMTAQVTSDQLGADDNPVYEQLISYDGYEVSITMAALGTEVTSYLLGTTIDAHGVEIENANDSAPYVAMGFKALRSDGSYDYIWLYKGKFGPSDTTYHTKEQGNVNWQTPSLSGTFGPRDYDKDTKAVVHSTLTGDGAAALLAGFFDAVYAKS